MGLLNASSEVIDWRHDGLPRQGGFRIRYLFAAASTECTRATHARLWSLFQTELRVSLAVAMPEGYN